MSLRDDIPEIVKEFKAQQHRLIYHEDLYKIHEGNLKPYVIEELNKQLSEKSAKQAQHRVTPINILKRLIDKLSKLYAKPPTRKIMSGSDEASEVDSDLFQDLLTDLNPNRIGVTANKFFNLTKMVAYEPVLLNGKPTIRILPAHQFFVMGMDDSDPMHMTHFIKIMGTKEDEQGNKSIILFCYTDEEFLAIDDRGNTDIDIMQREDIAALGGLNPIGVIPFVYCSRSETELTPELDTDLKSMVTLIPVLLTDINYALMFQCFSIVTLTNVKEENLKRAPNAAWVLQKDDAQGPDPKVDVIKPEVDSDKALAVLKSILSLWMTSKNIKPGAMGDMSVENVASGVAKIIDESDTSEDRQNQVPFIQDAEEKLYNLIINHMHPHWLTVGTYKYKQSFSDGITVSVTFAEQKPIIDSSKSIADQQAKITMGIQSKYGALQELYPDWNDDDIEAKLLEIKEEAALDQVAQQKVNAEAQQAMITVMEEKAKGDALTEEEPPATATSGGGK